MSNFGPSQFFTLGATTTAVTANISQTLGSAQNPAPLYNARVYNSGTSICFVTFGGSGVVATATTGIPIAPNGPAEIFNMGGAAKAVSAIAAVGSSVVYVQV